MTTNEKSNSQILIWNNMDKDSKSLKRQNVLVKTRKLNIVVGQGSLPQTMFADDGNSSFDVSNWRLSVRGHNLAHLTRSTTRTWPPWNPKTAHKKRYQENDTTLKVKQPDLDIAQNRKDPINPKRQNVLVERTKKVNYFDE